MKLYQLLWTLIKHGLHGRFRDEVFVSVELETETRSIGIVGPVTSFEWTDDADAFCTINGTSEDDEPWSEDPPFIDRLIEASSLGAPEAKVLRESAPAEQVERIMARVRELDAQDPPPIPTVPSFDNGPRFAEGEHRLYGPVGRWDR